MSQATMHDSVHVVCVNLCEIYTCTNKTKQKTATDVQKNVLN